MKCGNALRENGTVTKYHQALRRVADAQIQRYAVWAFGSDETATIKAHSVGGALRAFLEIPVDRAGYVELLDIRLSSGKALLTVRFHAKVEYGIGYNESSIVYVRMLGE